MPRHDDIERAKLGDRDAMNRLLEEYKGLAYSIALKYTRQEADAEDIVQEAFIKVFLHLGKFRNESAFSTWLFKIVYFESLRSLGRKKPFVDIEDEQVLSARDQGSTGLAKAEKRVALSRAMQSLTANEYLIIHLYYLAEKDLKEIQAITNQSRANIKVLLHRARKKMAGYFDLHNITKDLI